jgi:hypothetical protein
VWNTESKTLRWIYTQENFDNLLKLLLIANRGSGFTLLFMLIALAPEACTTVQFSQSLQAAG